MPKRIVSERELRKRGAESLITAVLALVFLGMPLVFVLVPVIEIAAVFRANSANNELRKRGLESSMTGRIAIVIGMVLAVITLIYVAVAILAVAERLQDRHDEAPKPLPSTLDLEPPRERPDAAVPELARRYLYRVDTARHVLERAQKIEVAGLAITGFDRRIEIENLGTTDLAFHVVVESSPGCTSSVAPDTNNLVVLPAGETTKRGECAVGGNTRVTTVETLALPPLAARNVRKVDPRLFGLLPYHLQKDHFVLPSCFGDAAIDAQLKPKRTWRDLVDFYARHDCESYVIDGDYRAFSIDNERPLPAGSPRTK